jgi:hypothetical protein
MKKPFLHSRLLIQVTIAISPERNMAFNLRALCAASSENGISADASSVFYMTVNVHKTIIVTRTDNPHISLVTINRTRHYRTPISNRTAPGLRSSWAEFTKMTPVRHPAREHTYQDTYRYDSHHDIVISQKKPEDITFRGKEWLTPAGYEFRYGHRV